jgi:hypothetical protein
LQEPRLALERVRSQELMKNHNGDCYYIALAFSFQVKSIKANLEDKGYLYQDIYSIVSAGMFASCAKTAEKN